MVAPVFWHAKPRRRKGECIRTPLALKFFRMESALRAGKSAKERDSGMSVTFVLLPQIGLARRRELLGFNNIEVPVVWSKGRRNAGLNYRYDYNFRCFSYKL